MANGHSSFNKQKRLIFIFRDFANKAVIPKAVDSVIDMRPALAQEKHTNKEIYKGVDNACKGDGFGPCGTVL